MQPSVSRRSLFGLAGGSAAALGFAGSTAALALAPTAARAATNTKPPFAPAPGTAMLMRNENPYGPSPAALKAIAEHAAHGCYYANGGEQALAAAIAQRHGLTPAHILIGAGSNEVLNCATMALGRKGGIVASDLTFDPPLRYAEGKGVPMTRVPLKADLSQDLDRIASAVTPDTSAVHICNPNNPTGRLIPAADVRALAAALPGHVTLILDEAYNELTPDPAANTLIDRVKAGDNIIIARTFSKIYGLAGLRIGYAIARPDLIAKLKPWSMSVGNSTAGLAAALATYDDAEFLAFSRAKIVEARQLLTEAATKAGLETLPSATNFVYVKVPDADRLQKALQAQSILIRGSYGPKWTEWSRVSCGKMEDVARYAEALPALVRA
jgi:histidinol-phosphate aminotransferase